MIPFGRKTCPAGCKRFGDDAETLSLAKDRLQEIRKEYPEACLGDLKNTRIIYSYPVDHTRYYQNDHPA